MNPQRINADLFFIDYKRKRNLLFLFPLMLTVLALVAFALFFFNLLPISIEQLYCYVIAGAAGIFLLTTIIIGVNGRDKTKLPTSEQIAGLLAEDIATVKQTMQAQLSPEFSGGVSKEAVIVNHCEQSVLGFRPYVKKAKDNKIYCSLNKITVFSFGARKLQIHTQIVDILTGIDIMQKTVKIPYSDITNCYIAYENGMKTESVKFEEDRVLNRNKLLPKFVSAVKDCKEILRICVNESESGLMTTHDIVVADYRLYYTADGLYKSIVSLSEGRELEKELLRRSGHFVADKPQQDGSAKVYNFLDEIPFVQKKTNA